MPAPTTPSDYYQLIAQSELLEPHRLSGYQEGLRAAKAEPRDAIELAQAGDTIDPLALLDLDIPGGSVEGRPASPELLAAVWLDQVRAQGRRA